MATSNIYQGPRRGQSQNTKTYDYGLRYVDINIHSEALVKRLKSNKLYKLKKYKARHLYKYTETQMKLLNKAATLIKNKGEIIYMVCSFFEQETTTQIKKFLTLNKNFTIIKFDKKNNENENLIDENGFINIVPCTLKNNIRIDGFFAAKLKRND